MSGRSRREGGSHRGPDLAPGVAGRDHEAMPRDLPALARAAPAVACLTKGKAPHRAIFEVESLNPSFRQPKLNIRPEPGFGGHVRGKIVSRSRVSVLGFSAQSTGSGETEPHMRPDEILGHAPTQESRSKHQRHESGCGPID